MTEDDHILDKPTVLVVDDMPENISMMGTLLLDHYKVKIANNGEKALKVAATGKPPDIILLDIMMPVMDGYETCRQLKANERTRDIPVIFLTAKSDMEDEMKGFELGAVDYITKPISPPLLLARLKTHLQMKRVNDFLRNQNEFLEAEVARRTRETLAVQEVTIQVMASLAETRDNDTGNHIRRTQLYIKALAEKLRKHPRFSDFLDSDKVIEMLVKSAPLHDIGKVGISDTILLKPDRLTEEECEIMKTHCALGRDSIIAAEQSLGLDMTFLSFAKEMAYSHHERWDGTGYPLELSGDDIPISGRLMAVADVYDSLISRRVYKRAMSHEEAVKIIVDGKNSLFDPEIVEVFVEMSEQFREIAGRHADAKTGNKNFNEETAAS